jgi:hypothetical protein
MAAARGPRADGVKVTDRLQFAPAAIEAPHVFVDAKSAMSTPVIATPTITSAEEPLFIRVIVCALLGVPLSSAPKERLGDEATSVSGSKRMETLNVCEALCPAESVTCKVNACP